MVNATADEEARPLTCSRCGRRIATCAFCEDASCAPVICARCLREALGESLALPHGHRGWISLCSPDLSSPGTGMPPVGPATLGGSPGDATRSSLQCCSCREGRRELDLHPGSGDLRPRAVTTFACVPTSG